MKTKKFRKLLRAHFTAYYMLNKNELKGWIANSYKAAARATAGNNEQALAAIKNALPISK